MQDNGKKQERTEDPVEKVHHVFNHLKPPVNLMFDAPMYAYHSSGG